MRSIQLNSLEAIANANEVLLVEVNPVYSYIDGKRTEKIEATSYICVLPKAQYIRITVKVLDVTPVVTNEYLEEIGGSVSISFSTFRAKIYVYNGMLGLQCSANEALLV